MRDYSRLFDRAPDLDALLAARTAFGEPEVDRTPWRGDDFRI